MSALGAVGIVGNLLGGGIEQWGAAVQSHRGRQFAREMAGTQYQRAVADMKAAGLNPMAIFGSGGGSPAPSPTGTFSNPGAGASKLGDELVKGYSAGAVNEALRAQAAIAQSSARAVESDTELKLAENSAYKAALETDVGRVGAVQQRYGTLGGAGEVMGALGAGNFLGGEASAKRVEEHNAAFIKALELSPEGKAAVLRRKADLEEAERKRPKYGRGGFGPNSSRSWEEGR